MQTAPYGAWTSPISAADVAAAEALVEWVRFVGDEVWWTESRPAEGGRSALVRHAADGSGVHDVLGPGWNVRTRVIEYGGLPWLPLGRGERAPFVFTHWDDQRLYLATSASQPSALTPPTGAHYADFAVRGNEVWCLREQARGPAPADVHRDLIAVPLDGSAAEDPARIRVLAASHHLLTGPKVSPDGTKVAWLGWDHPRMPWQETDLMCADIRSDGALGPARRIVGGDQISIGQVEWVPDVPDTLYVLSDPGGWWNIHELTLDGILRNLCPRQEEFGEALWRIGARWFLPIGGGRLFVVHGTSGRQLAVLEKDGALRDLGSPYTEWAALATDGTRVAGTAASPRHRRTVVLVTPDDSAGAVPSDGSAVIEVLRDAPLPHAPYLPVGRHHLFHGAAGEEVHAFVYLPHNPDFRAPEDEIPPFLVHVHGGPTSRTQMVANLEYAFFTSRGIGIVDVQYGGSTGYGRAYRERLHGNWGVVDVSDCATAARGLIADGLADPERIGIRGGSAGGWTSVASLGAEPDLYRAAGIYFPLLDPVTWRTCGTHDFESHYLDSLIGTWPEAAARYDEVSPLRRADRIRAPFVLMQGLEDEVCPPEQCEMLLDALTGRDVECRYLTFEGEQHGFRKAETIISCLTAELALYSRVFRCTPMAP